MKNHNGLIVTRPEIAVGATEVVLNVDTSKVEGWDAQGAVVEQAVGHLNTSMSSLAHSNATEAKGIFAEFEEVGIVESSIGLGGCDLAVTTHRDYQEGDGEVIQFFTQGQCVTGIGADIVEATAGIWGDSDE